MTEVIDLIASFMFLDHGGKEASKEEHLRTHTRLVVSVLFEFSLWENPKEAASLYTQHYGRLDVEISDPSLWALDTFRNIDLIIHNYVIGAVVAEKTRKYLEDNYGTDFQVWGNGWNGTTLLTEEKDPYKRK